MIKGATLSFLRDLKSNNTREWFELHKSEYLQAYDDMLDLTSGLLTNITSFDSGVASSGLDPKSCIMRIYRDVRFSDDKSPYKTNFFLFINHRGKKSPFGGYYLHIEPGGQSFAGGGVYMPALPVLDRLRAGIAENFDAWKAIVGEEQFRREFPGGVLPSGILKRPPKGYAADDPAIEFLKYKGYYTQCFLSDAEVLAPDFFNRLVGIYRIVQPMVNFLNHTLC